MSLEKILIIINGLPATGKTTLARQLSECLGMPLFVKDDYKEAIFDGVGYSDRAWSIKVGAAAIEIHFSVVEACLRVGQSCLMENFFRNEIFSGRITELALKYGFRCIQILVKADGGEVYRRFVERARFGSRHPGHDDSNSLEAVKPTLMQGRLEPLDISGTLIEVDTTDFSIVDAANIAGLIQNFIA